jgi:PadR family transcriptional regulator PadR
VRRTDQARRVATAILEQPTADHYGYDLCGRAGVRSGVLYPILRRMLREGWLADVSEEWAGYEPSGSIPRRYYRLTPLGLDAMREYVKETP